MDFEDLEIEDYNIEVNPATIYEWGDSCPILRNPKKKKYKDESNLSKYRYKRDKKCSKVVRKLQRRLLTVTGIHINVKYGIEELGINLYEVEAFLGKEPFKGAEIDHVIPLNCFNLHNVEELRLACHPWNHRWTTKQYNTGRQKVWDEWEFISHVLSLCVFKDSFKYSKWMIQSVLLIFYPNLAKPQIVMVL